jgi:hypothetical protein
MKHLFATAMLWLMSAFFINAAEAPLAVELNGIVNFSGFDCAFFVLDQPGSSALRSFMLTQGESRFGIKLLAMDATSGCVQIVNCGQKQSLRICSAPDLTSSSVSGTAGYPAKSFARNANNGSNSIGNSDSDTSVNPATIPGNPGFGTIPKNDNNANSSPSRNSSQNSVVNSAGADPATAFKDESNTQWYQDSVSIEESRQETAQQVLSGEMTPWPRTPLTPPGTPGNLIGAEAFFSNHIPGFHPQ